MAKKLTFDGVPGAVEKILEILTDPDNGHEALPELLRRLAVVEKKLDYIQKQMSPNRPVMDLQSACRILKIRPKAAYELAAQGILPSHSEGKKTFFYEDDVVKFFMNQPAWSAAAAANPTEKSALSSTAAAAHNTEKLTKSTRSAEATSPEKSASVFPAAAANTPEKPATTYLSVADRQPISMDAACIILERSAAAVYQLKAKNRIPFHKNGPKKIYFYEDELREWLKDNRPRQRRKKSE